MYVITLKIETDKGEVYNASHTAPSAFNELNKAQLLFWAATMTSKLQVNDALAQLAVFMFQLPDSAIKHLQKSVAMQMADCVKFLIGKNRLNNWLIPVISHSIFKYHGPKNKLSNVTVKEFTLTEYCYEQFQNTQNEEYLDTLLGILYRPQRFINIDDDIRMPLTTHGYVKRAKRFKKLRKNIKYAIYLNYEGCRNYIIEQNRIVFTGGQSNGNGKQQKSNITPWANIVEAASNDIFGTHSETKAANLHDFLKRLGSRIKEAEELKAK